THAITCIEKIVDCIIDFAHNVFKVKGVPMCSIIKSITDIIYERKLYKNVLTSMCASLRLAYLLIYDAPDHALIYRGEIMDIVWNGLRSKCQDHAQEALWTLGAMAASRRREWRKGAMDTANAENSLLDLIRSDEVNRKTTEMAICALVQILRMTNNECRYIYDLRYGMLISRLIKDWLPITIITEAFETVYSFLAMLIETKDQAIDIDKNEDRLLLIIAS
ncbi:hypothetical protein PMAYCL1PPCAC_01726, partial [Pristionchus mayeri]